MLAITVLFENYRLTETNYPSVTEQQWFFVAIVLTGSTETDVAYHYVNEDRQEFTVDKSRTSTGPGDRAISVGQERTADGMWVDELNFWNVALTDDQVDMLYNSYE